MKQIKISLIFIFSISLISSKLTITPEAEMNIYNQLGAEVGELKSNVQNLVIEENKEFISNPSTNFESGIIETVKSLSKQFDEYNKNIIEEGSESEPSVNPKLNKENYLDEIINVTSDLSNTVSSLVKIEKNDFEKEKITVEISKIQRLKKNFEEAKEKIKYLRTLKENNDLLKQNTDKAKSVMGNLIVLYNDYLSTEKNIKSSLDGNLDEIKKEFQHSDNLLSNIGFFSALFEKIENFYYMLQESSMSKEEKEKNEKIRLFINQTNQLDRLNRNFNERIEEEIKKVQEISDHHDRLKSMGNLLNMSKVLKSLNEKVLKLRVYICKKMKISLESNIEQVANLIKNSSHIDIENSSLNRVKSLVKISEERKIAVDNVKFKILSHLNNVEGLIKSNMNHFSEDFKDGKLGVGKTVINNFSALDSCFKELTSLNVSYDMKQRTKVNYLIETTKSILHQMEELISNSKNILIMLKKNNQVQTAIKIEYNNILQKIESLKLNLESSSNFDSKSIEEMNSEIKNYSQAYQSLKTGEVRTVIQKENLKKFLNTNESILKNISVDKVINQIRKLEDLNKK